jgi:purine-cytosine permease-like protein
MIVAGTLPSIYPPASDLAGHIERRGIEQIPDDERHAKSKDLAWVFFGSQINYGSLVIGALPVAFGLDWKGALTADLVGTLIGALAVAAMALIGPLTGTNSTVASSAFFGQRGRYVGSFITQTIDLGYFALLLWVSAPPFVHACHVAFGLSEGQVEIKVALLLVALLVLTLGIFGHATLVVFQKLTGFISFVGIALILWFCLGHFKPTPASNIPLVLGGWWPSWMLAVTVLISNAISYAPFSGDYARYLPSHSPPKAVFGWLLLGLVAGCLFGCGAGTLIGLSVNNPNATTLLMFGTLPRFLVLPVAIIGIIANVSNGGMVVYNGMLDLQAILWRLTRLKVGLLFSALGLIVSYIGLVAYNFSDSILAFCSIVTILVTPWTIINLVGYLRHGRVFVTADLHAFARGGQNGSYWYHAGFNIPAMIAWLGSVAVGLMFSSTSLFAGPLAKLAHGVDLSFLSAAGVGAALYIGLDLIVPSTAQILKNQRLIASAADPKC